MTRKEVKDTKGSFAIFVFQNPSHITGQIRSGGSARSETRRRLERRLPVLMERLNELVDNVTVQAVKKGYKGLVIIVDSLEKMHLTFLEGGQTNHSLLFVEHSEQLKTLRCHIVSTPCPSRCSTTATWALLSPMWT